MRKTIEIGRTAGGHPVNFDIGTLIKTRLLLCANSGGGKSWAIRRLIELLAGALPTIVFDVEGEFATLREKFDFVLVGPGGETPADCRSAKLVIQKLLELRASAVIDLSELSIADRHRYVKLAAEAAINSPKNLWRPTAFIFDEAHEFCPESSKGQSEAKAAVLAFATKGRKRQFLAIFATQRVHKLALDCRAELLNRMIGMTFEPDDLKVAREILGIAGKDDVAEFNRQMRTMEEGNFFIFGRAACLTTTLIKVGPIQTSHGIEEAKAFKAPPAPANIRALLPKLADLPQQAEDAAKTEAELRADVRRLTGELAAAKRAQPAPAPVKASKPVEVRVPIIKPEHMAFIRNASNKLDSILSSMEEAAGKSKAACEILKGLDSALTAAAEFQTKTIPLDRAIMHIPPTSKNRSLPEVVDDAIAGIKIPKPGESVEVDLNGTMKPGEINCLTAIAQNPEGITREHISVLTAYKVTTRKTYLAFLRQRAYIEERGNLIFATEAGVAALGTGFKPLPTGAALIEYWRARLPDGELKIFDYAIATGEFGNDDQLEAATAYKVTTRKTYIAKLVARHVLEPAGRGRYKLTKAFSL